MHLNISVKTLQANLHQGFEIIELIGGGTKS